MASIISQESLEIVRATATAVRDNALEITGTFYPKMLGRNPQLFAFFNESNQRVGRQAGAFSELLSGGRTEEDGLMASAQQRTLADAVIAYALNIENLDSLSETVTRIAHKHCALGVKPEHYQIVHDNLMEAIGDVLGSAVTPEVAAAWNSPPPAPLAPEPNRPPRRRCHPLRRRRATRGVSDRATSSPPPPARPSTPP